MLKKVIPFLLLLCLPLSGVAAPINFTDDFSDAGYADNWVNPFPGDAVFTQANGVLEAAVNPGGDASVLEFAGWSLANSGLSMSVDLRFQPGVTNHSAGFFIGAQGTAGAYMVGFENNLFFFRSTESGTNLAEYDWTGFFPISNFSLDQFFTIELLNVSSSESHFTLRQGGTSIDWFGFNLDMVNGLGSGAGAVGFWSTEDSGLASFDNFAITGDGTQVVVSGQGSGPAPVPEPSTWLMLGSGLTGLAWYGRRRKKE